MFANYKYFIEAILPVAEEANVKMALHPDDPPVPMLGGVARIFKEPEDFKRAWKLNPKSEHWGLDLCLGCCSEMPGGAANVREMIRFFGPKGRIFYVHFRDVKGTVPNFTECFIGEGNYNPAEMMALLKELHAGGATICMVTHDTRYAEHAHRSVHLFDGRVVEEQTHNN